MTDTAKEVVEMLTKHIAPALSSEGYHVYAEVLVDFAGRFATLQYAFEKARADVVRLEWEVADKQSRIESLEAELGRGK